MPRALEGVNRRRRLARSRGILADLAVGAHYEERRSAGVSVDVSDSFAIRWPGERV